MKQFFPRTLFVAAFLAFSTCHPSAGLSLEEIEKYAEMMTEFGVKRTIEGYLNPPTREEQLAIINEMGKNIQGSITAMRDQGSEMRDQGSELSDDELLQQVFKPLIDATQNPTEQEFMRKIWADEPLKLEDLPAQFQALIEQGEMSLQDVQAICALVAKKSLECVKNSSMTITEGKKLASMSPASMSHGNIESNDPALSPIAQKILRILQDAIPKDTVNPWKPLIMKAYGLDSALNNKA